jgi:hypothetical protein
MIIDFRNRLSIMPSSRDPLQRVLSGFIRMHVLHHAEEGNLCGHWMIEELRHHGYRMSAGTLYPTKRAERGAGCIASRRGDG